jgi:hypothetical protein
LKALLSLIFIALSLPCFSQKDSIYDFSVDDVLITVDLPRPFLQQLPTTVILYALPNGNSTAQTMGRKMREGDDWHFDIQHIRAQTKFIRKQWKSRNVIVVYLENDFKSWPQWKARHNDYQQRIAAIFDTIQKTTVRNNADIYLNGHSGGGRFIFSLMDIWTEIPPNVKRISFLDSNYGYDSTYQARLLHWLKSSPSNHLNVFAYNDSIALYNDKPVVSATGGTWYRSHWMLRDLLPHYKFRKVKDDSLTVYKGAGNRIQFFFKNNPDRKIYHTQQVELNGFIHSVFAGTPLDSRQYRYYGPRAYVPE